MLSPLKGRTLASMGIARRSAGLADDAARAAASIADDALRAARRSSLSRTADALGDVDSVLLGKLAKGVDIAIPKGTKGIRTLMSDISVVTGNETALLRLANGARVIRMGSPTAVKLSPAVTRVIAHTHPVSRRLTFSTADILAFQARGQRSSVIIDPFGNMGARLPVPR